MKRVVATLTAALAFALPAAAGHASVNPAGSCTQNHPDCCGWVAPPFFCRHKH